MLRRSAFVLALYTTLVPCALHAWAQGGVNGSIVGTVYDQSGMPLKGIKIKVASDTEIGGARVAYSNDDGQFRFSALSPGRFEIQASAVKLKTVITRNVIVGISAPTEVNVVMEVEAASEEVTIVERAPLIDTKSAAIKETLDTDLIQSMPVDERNNVHLQLIGQVAGAVGQAVRGGRPNQTIFTQDGFDLRELFPTLKSSAAYEIMTGGQGIDAPSASGAMVNLVTRSGSNNYEFEMNASAEHDKLRFFTDPNEQLAGGYVVVFGPTVAGPIIKDRLWFFADLESQHYSTSRADDPSGLIGYRPPFLRWLDKGTIKLTAQLTPRNRIHYLTNFTVGSEANRRAGVGVTPEAQESRQWRRLFGGLIWESLLTDNQVLRSQVGVTYYGDHFYPNRCVDEPIACDHIAPIRQIFPFDRDANNSDRHLRLDTMEIQLINRYDLFLQTKRLGEHDLSVRSVFFTEQRTDRNSIPGDTITSYNGAAPVRRVTFYVNDPRREPERQGWFIQGLAWYRHTATLSDAWRLTRYLTLNLGLSYVWGQAGNSRLGEGMNDQAFVPAASVAWDATHDGRTVVRASASNFADLDLDAVSRHSVGPQVSQNCEWNPNTENFDRNCFYEGGPSGNTIGLPCGPTGFDLEGRSCRERLQIPRTTELNLGAEREVIPGVAVSLDGALRNYANQYDVQETNRVWNSNGTLLDSTGGFRNGKNQTVADLGTRDSSNRRWMGLTFGASKRDGRLKMNASYTWARLEGAADAYGDVPAQKPYLYGYLGDDHRHEVKIISQYQVSRWVSTGLRYFWRSGVPYDRRYLNGFTGTFIDNRARIGYSPGANINDPGDDRELRLPDLQSFNLQVRINLQPLFRHRVELYADVLNVLGLRTVVAVNQNDGPAFGVATDRQAPLRMRLGVNFRY